MRILSIRHVPFENEAYISNWAAMRGHSLIHGDIYADASLPAHAAYDILVVMGGPMNIYEDDTYPWLAAEKEYIGEAVENGKMVLGICLGAQLIADVLGATVTKNSVPEIGWFHVALNDEGKALPAFRAFPAVFPAFHWHGDTFSLPPDCVHVGFSEGCKNQAFAFDGGRVVGLQFHLEATTSSVENLITNCGHEIVPGKYVQTPQEMRSKLSHVPNCNKLMADLLDRTVEAFGS